MKPCSFEKHLFTFLGGAAAGVAIGILFAPNKGSVTRKKIARQARKITDEVSERFEDLKDRAEELIDEIKDAACGLSEEELDEE